MELLQTQAQKLNFQQIQGLRLLQMSAPELEQYLRELAQENPMVDLEPDSSALAGGQRPPEPLLLTDE